MNTTSISHKITFHNYDLGSYDSELYANVKPDYATLYDNSYSYLKHEFTDYNMIQLRFEDIEVLYNNMKKLQGIK